MVDGKVLRFQYFRNKELMSFTAVPSAIKRLLIPTASFYGIYGYCLLLVYESAQDYMQKLYKMTGKETTTTFTGKNAHINHT